MLPLAVATGAVAIAGCTWVKLTSPAESVRVGTAAGAADCKQLRAVHAKTTTKVAFFSRSRKKVDEEVETLARNEAAEMGGDTIVAQGPTSSEGRRSFDVYRCSVP